MLSSRRTIHTEWGDCDPAGIVFYPRYFEYFNACTHVLLERAGWRRLDMQREHQISGFPLVDVRARVIVPLRYDEDVVVESRVTAIGRSSFRIQHGLYRGDVLAVEASETRVCVNRSAEKPGEMKARPIPPELTKKLAEPES
jgi:4-hydroxybenzoyl-CoA thioesterase